MKKFLYFIFFLACFLIGFGGFTYFKPPKISVIMSTYNRQDLLPAAIESILNQTYKDFEFIIINDGSNDNTVNILKEYAQKDKRIKVIDNESNKGLIYSLNRGLKEARGKYIARMDDDDISLPERFEMQLNYMEEHPHVTVLGTAFYIDKKNGEKWDYSISGSSDPHETHIISYFQVTSLHPTTFIRRNFLEKHQIKYDQKYPSAEDTYFWYTIARKGGVIKNIIDPLYVYYPNSQKFQGYHSEQARSYKAFLQESLAPFMETQDLTFPPNTKQTCLILQNMRETAKHKTVDFDLETLDNLIKQRGCKIEE